MSARNTASRYGSVAQTFHWLTALLILTAIPLGLIANGLPFDTDEALARKAWVFSLHKTVGVAAFFLGLARILWALTQPRPAPLHPDRKAETFLAGVVHWLLYGSLVLVPLTGWAHHAATQGFAPILWPFGQNLPGVPEDAHTAHLFASMHWLFTKLLAVSVGLHIAGAIKHAVIDRDGTLARMLPGDSAGDAPAPHGRTLAPFATALGIWGAALLGGYALGQGADDADLRAGLAPVETEWMVTDGTLGISVIQLGSSVSGGFADWTAAITFDEDTDDDVKGDVTVTIAIGSLTLGSVANQAMGAEFFDAEAFATATYIGSIVNEEGAYFARGTLTIKGIAVPLDFPFDLTLDGDMASMSAQFDLDRRDFDIGTVSYKDEKSLGFPVAVTVNLTATR